MAINDSHRGWRSSIWVSRCIGAGDTGREEEFTTLFADEGVFEIGDRRSTHGAQQITA